MHTPYSFVAENRLSQLQNDFLKNYLLFFMLLVEATFLFNHDWVKLEHWISCFLYPYSSVYLYFS